MYLHIAHVKSLTNAQTKRDVSDVTVIALSRGPLTADVCNHFAGQISL